tara:strand:- start:603 stop:827 length:225 start_codon:yes stop_codon:yes gene_type:complete
MIHAFLLTVFLGQQIVSKDMYFYNIDTCRYFAERLNKQPPVPNLGAGDDEPKRLTHIAVCQPKLVDPERIKIYD